MKLDLRTHLTNEIDIRQLHVGKKLKYCLKIWRSRYLKRLEEWEWLALFLVGCFWCKICTMQQEGSPSNFTFTKNMSR